MTNYVLIHGAWHGGWCWAPVARRLRGAGHDVFTPTLTGLGDRAHLAGPDVDLATHITDTVATLEMEELSGVVLVGHSYGGMVITGAADRAAERIAALVYLDAFIPRDGESLFSYQRPEIVAERRRIARETGDGWRVPPPTPEYFGVRDAADANWVRRRCVDQPIATMDQPVSLTGAGDAIARRVYILAAEYQHSPFGVFAERVRDDPAWDFHTLPCGHDVMVDMPDALADILLGLA